MEVGDFLKKCKLEQYYSTFVSEGFDQLNSLLEITENDLVAMDVKRGHRRLLQREIASMRAFNHSQAFGLSLIPNDESFLSISDTVSTSPVISRMLTPGALSPHSLTIQGHRQISLNTGQYSNPAGKRRYRRHPKPDKNAPEKPASAYVMFSNKVRAEYKNQNMTFTEIAKIVGDRWKAISREEKEQVELSATQAREGYYEALRSYKETDEYKEYQMYLAEFRKKSSSCVRPVGRPRKHPRSDDKIESTMTDPVDNQPSFAYGFELPQSHAFANNRHSESGLEYAVNQPDQTFMI
ncbi:HMG-box [Basidiobolus meristosporus CBS 931.73]|uniref:HMG-box n=1 Tax=Basidiobolus meristosporus CBS 931.73 TaxID=1314790 RepID=A0A1Y1XY77_9FUNG|nr:HMG-box [Basidiobolus meristosporus CBS 931.73]|eukprot:ORX90605.1 HMG-box [Basidiobolus meristosporus CBS 931.73]